MDATVLRVDQAEKSIRAAFSPCFPRGTPSRVELFGQHNRAYLLGAIAEAGE